MDRYKIPHVDKDVYSESEYAALVAAAETRGDILIRDMIIVAAGTGMRFEEIAHLTPSCIRWQNDFPEIEIRASNDWSPKDPLEVKQVPMMPKVREVIKRRCDESHSPQSYLFHNQNGQKVSNWKCRARLQRLFPQAVISPERTLHWHSFRNYFIIRCLRMGLLPNEIMPYTGHDSASMIFHYARALNPSDKQAAARKLCESEQKAGEKQGKDFSETAKNNQNIEFSI